MVRAVVQLIFCFSLYSGSALAVSPTCKIVLDTIGSYLDTQTATRGYSSGQVVFLQLSGGLVPARVVGVGESGYIVELPWSAAIGSVPMVMEVHPSQLRKTRTGTETVVVNSLVCMSGLCHRAKADDMVRFRASNGTMAQGRVVRVVGDNVQLAVSDGTSVVLTGVSREEIFSTVGPNVPLTPNYPDFPSGGHIPVTTEKGSAQIPVPPMRFVAPTGAARAFLDGSARLASLPDFQKKSHPDRLEVLMRYYATFNIVQDSFHSGLLEASGGDHLNGILGAGAVVCRQNAVALATMYSEAGYTTRIVWRTKSEVGPGPVPGHVWVEVDVPSGRGVKTYVVDRNLSAGEGEDLGMVIALSELEARAKADPTDSSALLYAHPDRHIISARPMTPR